ncbi:hypothetical protein BACCELL_01688 [Bacteroides cellulosilyticus DSM 14838]|nr:hypothetical protein BACCELL_01688 [Bacteroides cellulosilyticus DSM 14838]
MNMIKGWELSTGEKLYKKPARRTVRGYEATQITRIRPKNSIKDMGASISIMEFKECRSYKLIQKQDSLNYLKDTSISSTIWDVQSSEKVKRSVVLTYKANKHPETGESQILKIKTWYVQGKKNTYLISFATTEEQIWAKELPEMEKIALSLKEM